MSSTIVTTARVTVGQAAMVDSASPSQPYSVVFEDDGETGYFYACDPSVTASTIVDALHIYNVKSVVDRDRTSTVEIVWSSDGLKAALVINRFPHAVFDFAAKRGYCRTGYPPAQHAWTSQGHAWDDRAIDLFR